MGGATPTTAATAATAAAAPAPGNTTPVEVRLVPGTQLFEPRLDGRVLLGGGTRCVRALLRVSCEPLFKLLNPTAAEREQHVANLGGRCVGISRAQLSSEVDVRRGRRRKLRHGGDTVARGRACRTVVPRVVGRVVVGVGPSAIPTAVATPDPGTVRVLLVVPVVPVVAMVVMVMLVMVSRGWAVVMPRAVEHSLVSAPISTRRAAVGCRVRLRVVPRATVRPRWLLPWSWAPCRGGLTRRLVASLPAPPGACGRTAVRCRTAWRSVGLGLVSVLGWWG
mmetsp:Transcript_109/g.409  ORF Transcript_109/g.409 Transcript_109/m.409 type:complete len:279 (-) Transcript_109:413-1249(-)